MSHVYVQSRRNHNWLNTLQCLNVTITCCQFLAGRLPSRGVLDCFTWLACILTTGDQESESSFTDHTATVALPRSSKRQPVTSVTSTVVNLMGKTSRITFWTPRNNWLAALSMQNELPSAYTLRLNSFINKLIYIYIYKTSSFCCPLTAFRCTAAVSSHPHMCW